jgi:hypothetical protein
MLGHWHDEKLGKISIAPAFQLAGSFAVCASIRQAAGVWITVKIAFAPFASLSVFSGIRIGMAIDRAGCGTSDGS